MAQRKPINLNRISPLTDFLRNHKAHIESLKESGEPEILTVNGRAEAVVFSAKGFQLMLDDLNRAEEKAGILQGYVDMLEGRTTPLDQAIDEIRSELGLPSDSDGRGEDRAAGSG
jgi:PHD/YefM family antitoxin component YafN of YafNO toxin-antitoxin module